MKKKIYAIATFAILLLVGCRNSYSGFTVTLCIGAPSSIIEFGDTNITIYGRDSAIAFWREETIVLREDFVREFLPMMRATNDDIVEWFETDVINAVQGSTWELISVDNMFVRTRLTNHYEQMLTHDLNRMWETDDFEHEVTLSHAIAFIDSLSLGGCITEQR